VADPGIVAAVAYKTVLLDLDHTLLDSDASEVAAFDHALRSQGIDEPGRYFDGYVAINRTLWAGVERGELTPDQVRVTRFERLIASAGLEADPTTMAAAFTTGLGRFGDLYPEARPVLETLAGSVRLALVTNGLSDVQRARIERTGIRAYFDAIVISAEVGASKPGTEIFDLAFGVLGDPARSSTLMAGDSLSSDIAGGIAYGIDTCWYNPGRRPRPSDIEITHEIADLARLPTVVRNGSSS
jgi:YjjG family noncanonical pyrimidine nucleotidase